MSVIQNKRLVRRLFDEVYNEGNLDAADELIAKCYVSHKKLSIDVTGSAGIKKAAVMQRKAFPDLVSRLEDIIAEGDKVVARGVDTGTHAGQPFIGLPANGRKFTITWIDTFRVEKGKLSEAWLEIDVEDFRRQLS